MAVECFASYTEILKRIKERKRAKALKRKNKKPFQHIEKPYVPKTRKQQPKRQRQHAVIQKTNTVFANGIKISEDNEYIRIKSNYYYVVLSKKHGGTIRSLMFGKKDTGLHREGCEYWAESGEHYEQEYGKTLKIAKGNYLDGYKIEINAEVRSPNNRKVGGKCTTIYYFENTPFIRMSSLIFPLFKNVSVDKYVCFKNNNYEQYYINDNVNIIKNLLDDGGRLRQAYKNINKIKIEGKNKNLTVRTDELSMQMRIYKTSNMLEIKPEWNNDITKTMFLIVGEA